MTATPPSAPGPATASSDDPGLTSGEPGDLVQEVAADLPDDVAVDVPDPHVPAAAFFDVDNTIIRGASGYHLARELYRRKFFGMRDILIFGGHALAYALRGEDQQRIDAIRSRALGVIAGRTQAEIRAIGEEVYDQVFGSRVYPGARALIQAHLAAGHQVWLVTATPREIGELIARRLGATGALGTVAELADGAYTGRLVGSMMHGERKAAAVRELVHRLGMELEHCSAYGDSVNDVPMLASVGHPCAINPDAHLRLHCMDVGWPIRDFRPRRQGVKRGAFAAGVAASGWGLLVLLRRAVRTLRSGTP